MPPNDRPHRGDGGGGAVKKVADWFLSELCGAGTPLSRPLWQDGGMNNEEGRTQKAEGKRQGTTGTDAANGAGDSRRVQEWWDRLSQGERRLICSVMGLLRGAKRSQLQDVARAAAKWERGLGCFIKVRLMNGASRTGHLSKGAGQLQRRVSITVLPTPAHSSPSLRSPAPQRGEGVTPGVTSSPSAARSLRGVAPNPD